MMKGILPLPLKRFHFTICGLTVGLQETLEKLIDFGLHLISSLQPNIIFGWQTLTSSY